MTENHLNLRIIMNNAKLKLHQDLKFLCYCVVEVQPNTAVNFTLSQSIQHLLCSSFVLLYV